MLMAHRQRFVSSVFIGANGILYAEVLAWIGADLVLIPYFIYTFKKMK